MRSSRGGMRTLGAIVLAYLLAWPTPILAEGVLIIVAHQHQEGPPSSAGRSRITTTAQARYDGEPGDDMGRDASLGTGVKERNGTWNYINQGYLTTKTFTIQFDGQMEYCNSSCGGVETIDVCLVGNIPTQFDRKSEATIVRQCSGCYNYKTKKETVHSSSYCPIPPACYPSNCEATTGGEEPYCCGTPARCSECSNSRFQCEEKYGPPPQGQWLCTGCSCQLVSSPLVLYLPDYSSSGGGSQNWWREGLCTADAQTVCLDWSGDGLVTCTGWIVPESQIAFVVALSADDLLRLSDGLTVPAAPWRHFFGNVTMGPEGDFPFAHGFDALAAHCGLAPPTSEIDLVDCGLSLHVWGDGNGDGDIASDELLDFRDLGIQSLGDLRETGKRDACGNTFPYESHATCFGRNGRCRTWLDVFFLPR